MFARLLSALSLSRKGFFRVLTGCGIMAFTLVNVHIPAQITEGGILGLSLFFHKVLGLNPAMASPLLDMACIAVGVSLMGKTFRRRTAFASLAFAGLYKIALLIGPIVPSLYTMPFAAALIGGIGIGAGCGLVVTQGGAAGGDDVMAMVLAKKTGLGLARTYLIMDAAVLLLSLVYIPILRLFYSFVTTVVSSFLIGQFELRVQSPTLSSKAINQG